MFNAIAHALLALAPEFDAARVEDVPMSLKAWIDGSQGNIRRETLGAKCMARHFFAKLATWLRTRWGMCKTSG